MLKFILDTLEGVPADVASNYTKREDGKYVLGVEGQPAPEIDDATKRSLAEFRTNNIALLKEKEDLKLQLSTAQKGVGDTSALQKRLEDMEKTILEKNTADLWQKDVMGPILKETKVKPAYQKFLEGEAKGTFTVEDGKIVGKDGATVETFLTNFTTSYPDMVSKASGGGANGGGSGGTTKKLKDFVTGKDSAGNPIHDWVAAGNAAKDDVELLAEVKSYNETN